MKNILLLASCLLFATLFAGNSNHNEMNSKLQGVSSAQHNIDSSHEESGGWLQKWLMPHPGVFLWTLLTFLVVLTILTKFAWQPLMDALDERGKTISEALEQAEKTQVETEKQAEKNEEIINTAKKEAHNIISQARESGDKLKQKLELDGQKQYDNMLDKAKNQINIEKQKALSEINQAVVDLTIQASEKIIKRNLNEEDNIKIIQNTLDDFKQSNS